MTRDQRQRTSLIRLDFSRLDFLYRVDTSQGRLMKRTLAFVIMVALVALIVPPTRAAERYQMFLFGVAYYPEHWPESYWEQDATRMQECGVNTVRMAEFAWAVMEPVEGTYDFSLFDKAITVLARHGIKTILGTPTATPPKWLTEKYTEVLHVNADGRPADDQSRRHICYNSTVYREYTRKIVEAMAGHFRRTRTSPAGRSIMNSTAKTTNA